MQKQIFAFFTIFFLLITLSCSSQTRPGMLLRDTSVPPGVVQEIFSNEGKSDYILLNDEGYSIRLLYLCENRVYNFTEEPKQNYILVSMQPILDTPVEKRLLPEDRTRIWACMESKVREEINRFEEQKSRLTEERLQMEMAISATRAEAAFLAAEIEQRRILKAERQRLLEEEAKRLEEERIRKAEEEQRRKTEEERKVKIYKMAEKEEPLPAPKKVTESGIFLIMKDVNVYQEAREIERIQNKVRKYDLFEVISSKMDQNGVQWYQVLLHEKTISDKGKRLGWCPEERPFWIRNKLPVWIYPGDLSRIQSAKPLRLAVEEVQFTGKKVATSSKSLMYEVTYEVNSEYTERILGWVEEKSGIRRSDKSVDEMRALLRDLSLTAWPMAIQNDILGGYIRKGFTPEQVTLAWGRPDHVNATRTLVGLHEQWVYGETPFPNAYVYFDNGVVSSWEFLKTSK